MIRHHLKRDGDLSYSLSKINVSEFGRTFCEIEKGMAVNLRKYWHIFLWLDYSSLTTA